ncbi:MAG: bifunctional 3-deoxy-7-phosphoheptulonate synthase/chorismate mutase type II [Flavobacteriales bacterium]|nr:bifunctional 3-deoxy-7-phosphoheptulonate synthase/chorismate mutase type II [Flavobacteriales bacterium]
MSHIKELDFLLLNEWLDSGEKLPVIAGPCSAETEEQVMSTAEALMSTGFRGVFRAGVWKPRTRPNAFEGMGIKALPWLNRIQKETGMKVAIEVANAEHVQLALKYNIDIVWIGARTTVSPFSVQEIADALKGADIPVMVKNPVSPDLNLWIGALERINKVGIKKLIAVHRGFSNYQTSHYRNQPRWEIPIQLMALYPGLPVFCDPSHISGKREWIFEVAQKSIGLGMHGLMMETHIQPEQAWSDADQQITPNRLNEIIQSLRLPDDKAGTSQINRELMHLRRIIDSIDEELIQVLAKRMQIVEKIGQNKKENNITIFQLERWNEIMESCRQHAANFGINLDFVEQIMQEVHKESIQIQSDQIIPYPSFTDKTLSSD